MTYYLCFCYHICHMFYWVKYFSISIMRFKITSALALHRFIKISLRRMFSRSVSGRPLRKPNNFCISPLASDRLFKAFISLSVKRCLGYLPSNRLRAYALVVSPQRAAYSAISLWSCGVSLTIRRLVYFGASFSIIFLFIPSIASIRCVTQCELASVQEVHWHTDKRSAFV